MKHKEIDNDEQRIKHCHSKPAMAWLSTRASAIDTTDIAIRRAAGYATKCLHAGLCERQSQVGIQSVNAYLAKEQTLVEAELNDLGEDSWEFTGVVSDAPFVYFYFKRPVR